jgi:hypothetical protein
MSLRSSGLRLLEKTNALQAMSGATRLSLQARPPTKNDGESGIPRPAGSQIDSHFRDDGGGCSDM